MAATRRNLWGMVKFHIGGKAHEAAKGCPSRFISCADGYSPDEKRKDPPFAGDIKSPWGDFLFGIKKCVLLLLL